MIREGKCEHWRQALAKGALHNERPNAALLQMHNE